MFRRIINLLKGFLTLLISGVEKRNLNALVELEKENLRKQMNKLKITLATVENLAKLLSSHIKKLEAEEWDLRAKIAVNLKANNREKAGRYALRLQTVKRRLSESRIQFNQSEISLKDLAAAHDQVLEVAGKSHHHDALSYANEAELSALAEMALNQFIIQEGLEMPKSIEDKRQVKSTESNVHPENHEEAIEEATIVEPRKADSEIQH